MQTTGEDYYDIPDDELPSANFAARPSSEISELGLLDVDGIWSFMYFSATLTGYTSSNDEIDDGTTPTALAPETPFMPQPEMPRTPPDTPAITVTSPSRRQSLRQRLRSSVGDVAAIVRRSSMRQKADTAPPGAFNLMEYAPHVPRRTMSARLEKPDGTRRFSRHPSSDSDLKARRKLGMNETVLEEERPKLTGSSGQSQESEENEEKDFSQPNPSFSRKPRVRETLERKQLSRLRMDFVGTEPERFVESPQSMLGTPVELYAAPEPQPGRFRPTSAIHGKRGSSTPVSPKTPSPFLRPQTQPKDWSASNEDLEDLYQTRVYVPGPVCLEKHPALLRKNSVATLDPFAGEIESIGRRPSDSRALEQIVVYFDGMDVIREATDRCLDRYWLKGQQQALRETGLDATELEPLSSQRRQSSSSKGASRTLSRFSFSSASSDASVRPGTPQKRQLIRLRRLLSPALPGLKGAES